jgi:hypothetical protein
METRFVVGVTHVAMNFVVPTAERPDVTVCPKPYTCSFSIPVGGNRGACGRWSANRQWAIECAGAAVGWRFDAVGCERMQVNLGRGDGEGEVVCVCVCVCVIVRWVAV